jgi:hypothetical protein
VALGEAFRRLEEAVPESVAQVIRKLRRPGARWIRIPLGLLCIVGGVFSFLPVLGLWMLPLGLLLIAIDVPPLRRPVARFTLWGLDRWAAVRAWARRRWPGSASRSAAGNPPREAKATHAEPRERGGADSLVPPHTGRALTGPIPPSPRG